MHIFLEPLDDDAKGKMTRAGHNATTALTPTPAYRSGRLSQNWERGTTGSYVIAAFITCILLAVIFVPNYLNYCADFNQATLQTPNQTIHLALAVTPEQQSKGLGGCRKVPKNSGMYFPFTHTEERVFWMKDMVIPIDIIWIQNGKVVGIEKNAPNLPLGTSDSDLPRYISPVPVDAVLEVGAGMAQVYGIRVGVELTGVL